MAFELDLICINVAVGMGILQKLVTDVCFTVIINAMYYQASSPESLLLYCRDIRSKRTASDV